MALALTLHDGMDYYLRMPLDELNETAEMLVAYLEEVARRGKK